MATYLIRHSPVLSGEVEVHAAKNAVLPLLAAGLVTEEPLVLKEVPRITDVETLLTILRDCGAQVTRSGTEVSVCALQPQSPLHEENMRRLRASILILGPILARSGSACVGLPGGCAIGQRPIDLHLKGLQALGAQVHPLGGKRQLSGRLSGARIYLDLPSVGATENLMMAAAMARGLTVLENAAKEPEIVDLANCLNLMGASISGAGTETITILGVERLHGAVYRPIPDRIEAGTLLCAAAVTEGSVLVRGACAEHLRSLLFKLAETGVGIRETGLSHRYAGPDDRCCAALPRAEHDPRNRVREPFHARSRTLPAGRAYPSGEQRGAGGGRLSAAGNQPAQYRSPGGRGTNVGRADGGGRNAAQRPVGPY